MEILLNKATSDCSFINLSPIFTIYHFVAKIVFNLHSPNQSNNIHVPILVTKVTHNFPLKWFPWQPKSCGMLTISLLARMLRTCMVNIGLKLTTLPSEVALFSNIFTKGVCSLHWAL